MFVCPNPIKQYLCRQIAEKGGYNLIISENITWMHGFLGSMQNNLVSLFLLSKVSLLPPFTPPTRTRVHAPGVVRGGRCTLCHWPTLLGGWRGGRGGRQIGWVIHCEGRERERERETQRGRQDEDGRKEVSRVFFTDKVEPLSAGLIVWCRFQGLHLNHFQEFWQKTKRKKNLTYLNIGGK